MAKSSCSATAALPMTLNRPDVMNAIDDELPGALADAVARADNDPGAHTAWRALGGLFCAAMTWLTPPATRPIAMQETRGSDEGLCGHVRQYQQVHEPVPFEAAGDLKRHGFAVAGGSDIALCSDTIVMAEASAIRRFGSGAPDHGDVVYGSARSRCKRMLFTGDKITGVEAAALGLVLKAVPAEKLDDEVDALVHWMATVPQNQLMTQKLMVLNEGALQHGADGHTISLTVFDGMTRIRLEGSTSSGGRRRPAGSALSTSATMQLFVTTTNQRLL